MDLQDLKTGSMIRGWHEDELIEPARSQDGRVNHIGPVAGAYDDHVDQCFDAVHLSQQLANHVLRRSAVIGAHSSRGATESSSSKKIMDGAALRPFLKTSRMPFSDSPTHLLKSSGPLIEMKLASL